MNLLKIRDISCPLQYIFVLHELWKVLYSLIWMLAPSSDIIHRLSQILAKIKASMKSESLKRPVSRWVLCFAVLTSLVWLSSDMMTAGIHITGNEKLFLYL